MSTLTEQDLYQFPVEIDLAGDTVIVSLAETTSTEARWENEEKDLIVIGSIDEKGNKRWYICQQLPNGQFIEAEHSTLQGALTFFHLEKLLTL